MAQKPSPKKKATKKARARAKPRAVNSAPKPEPKSKPEKAAAPNLSIVLIDDEFAADAQAAHGYNRDNFLRDVGDIRAQWHFSDAFDSFTGFFLAEEALAFAKRTPKPDLFLVDLMFGEKRTLGMEIIVGLREMYPQVPIALLTTHGPDDVVTGEAGPTTIGAWVRGVGVGLISKNAIFQPGEFWRQIEPLLKGRRRAGVRRKPA
ncbi:MAG: response regulator [Hyphomonadaceae bacterium]